MSNKQLMRPNFFEGQYLGADDLASAVDYARWDQARHLLGAHTWGIATGLRLIEVRDPAGNITVFVQPGYAWDGFGRPIVVLTGALVPPDSLQGVAPGADVLAPVWLRYREVATSEPPAGFETCRNSEQNARVLESFVIEVGELTPELVRSNVTVGGRAVKAETAETPSNPDLSIPYQTFPAAGARWLIPLGMVKWRPGALGAPGSFQSATDDERALNRIYVGAVADAIQAPAGKIRLRPRSKAPTTVNSADVVWVEGDLRVDGNIRPFGKALQLVDQNGGDGGIPLEISRSGGQMHVRLGTPGSNARLDIGPGDATFHPKVSVLEHGELEVNGGDLLMKATGANPGNIVFQRDATEKARIWNPGGALRGLNFSAGGTTAQLAIDQSGRVGVGTDNPDHELTVNGPGPTSLNVKSGTNEMILTQLATAARVTSNQELQLRAGADGSIDLKTTGDVGIGRAGAAPEARLHVTGEAIKLNHPLDPNKHIVMRVNGTDVDLQSDNTHSLYLRSQLKTIINPSRFGDGKVGVGTENPLCKLHVSESAQASANFVESHIAVIENTSPNNNADVLALKVGIATPTTSNNYITFFSGGSAIAAIEGNGAGGVTYKTSGSDFAEFFPLAAGEAPAEPGDVIAVHDGLATRTTSHAGLVSAASPHPAVLGGHASGPGVSIGLIGQLMVKVRGPVAAGDLILPSGSNDGTAVALSAEAAAERGAAQVIGIAWQSSAEAGVKLIRTAVGLCGPLLQLLQAKLARLEAARA